MASTVALGPFTGEGAALHPENLSPYPIEYYGTDLGFSYEHQGALRFLFGDTWAIEAYAPIEKSTGSRYDDGFGSVDLKAWSDPDRITPDTIPLIKLAQNPGTSEMSAMNPGHAMDLGKTPMGGFSHGGREFGIFNLTKPQACLTSTDCGNQLACDNGLGYFGAKYDEEAGLTLGCVDGAANCVDDTMTGQDGAPLQGSGLCVDKTSNVWGESAAARISAIGIKQRIGIKDLSNPKQYTDIRVWLTNKFSNVTARTVARFLPANGGGYENQDYNRATAAGVQQRLFLWGRPGFVGVKANGRPLGLYFAYLDLPAAPGFSWELNYYTGTNGRGIPQFSKSEADAVPLDLDSRVAGVQTGEIHDIVNQMSVVWVEHLKKWIIFYGGGLSILPTKALPHCGVVELFTRTECAAVETGNGAIRMRSADDPWGPWSPPRDVIMGGDPALNGDGQYGIGGMLRHPTCTSSGCAPHSDTPFYSSDEYGFFYSANIIEAWIKPAGSGVNIIWNASTWDPYRVVLLRTRINP